MLARDAEPAVVAAEPGQVRRQRVGAVEAPDDLSEGMEQVLSLAVHGGREERAEARVLREKAAVEISGYILRSLLDEGETLLDRPWIERFHISVTRSSSGSVVLPSLEFGSLPGETQPVWAAKSQQIRSVIENGFSVIGE